MKYIPIPEYRKKVAAVIFNTQKEILLGRYFGNTPSYLTHHEGINRTFPGGGVDPGESYKQAMLREIHEEIGLKPYHLRLTFEYKKSVLLNIQYDKESDSTIKDDEHRKRVGILHTSSSRKRA